VTGTKTFSPKELDMKTGDLIFAVLCILILISLAYFVSALPSDGVVTDYNYARVTSGMNIVQVTAILGEGEIHYLDKRMVVMKYIGEGVEIRVIFVNGLVYQKSLELEGRVMNQDGNFLLPETEL
jgi:hypothetical protein